MDRLDYFGIRRRADLLPVGIDVPNPLDARGQVFLFGFGEGDVLLAQSGKGPWPVGIFDLVVRFNFVGDCCGGRKSCRLAGMGDGVLADDGGPVSESGGDMVREIGVDSGEDGDVVGDFADAAE